MVWRLSLLLLSLSFLGCPTQPPTPKAATPPHPTPQPLPPQLGDQPLARYYPALLDPTTRAQTLETLRTLRPTPTPDALRAGLLDPNPHTRSLATLDAALLGDAALPTLEALLDVPAARAHAIHTLPVLGASSLPPLVRSLSHDDPLARRLASLSLSRLGALAAPALPALEASIRTGADPLTPALALAALQGPGDDALRALLADPEPSLRHAAAAALATRGALGARALLPALDDDASLHGAELGVGLAGPRADPALRAALHEHTHKPQITCHHVEGVDEIYDALRERLHAESRASIGATSSTPPP